MTTDEKLDLVLGEIAEIKHEIQKLKNSNEQNAYNLETKVQEIFRGLRDNITSMDSANYHHYSNLDRIVRDVDKRIGKVEESTPINQLTEKISSWSPVILLSVFMWAVVIFIILQ